MQLSLKGGNNIKLDGFQMAQKLPQNHGKNVYE
jgi:hypothetical protein